MTYQSPSSTYAVGVLGTALSAVIIGVFFLVRWLAA